MRTTLTLDDDLARTLRREAARAGRPFKEVVNAAIRRGLTTPKASAKPYRLHPVSLGGVAPEVDLDRALRLADALEDEAIAAKLDARR